MASRAHYIALAKQLPPPLLRFLARYPPPAILPVSTPAADDGTPTTPTTPSFPSSSYSSAPATGQLTGYQLDRPTSPFRFWKHPVTGKWHDPVYSLRRQAELVRLARGYGVEELLPVSVKGTDSRVVKRVESGLRVKGTGVGQKVKGRKAERMLIRKMAVRRKAMLRMPKLVHKWRRTPKRRWKFYPKKHAVL